MNRMSKKREAAVRSGAVRLTFGSTFGRPQPGAIEARKGVTRRRNERKLGASRGELAKAKAAAWREFSRWVRLRDSDDHGNLKCCTCSTVKYWKSMHAGHFVSRKYTATFLLPVNVHGQCPGCNRFKSGAPLEYDAYLTARYGAGTPEQIRQLARSTVKPTAEEYRAEAAEYRRLADEIIERTPSKVKGMTKIRPEGLTLEDVMRVAVERGIYIHIGVATKDIAANPPRVTVQLSTLKGERVEAYAFDLVRGNPRQNLSFSVLLMERVNLFAPKRLIVL